MQHDLYVFKILLGEDIDKIYYHMNILTNYVATHIQLFALSLFKVIVQYCR